MGTLFLLPTQSSRPIPDYPVSLSHSQPFRCSHCDSLSSSAPALPSALLSLHWPLKSQAQGCLWSQQYKCHGSPSALARPVGVESKRHSETWSISLADRPQRTDPLPGCASWARCGRGVHAGLQPAPSQPHGLRPRRPAALSHPALCLRTAISLTAP